MNRLNKIKDVFFNSNFSIQSCNGDEWSCIHRLPSFGASADLFILKNKTSKQRAVAKLYNNGLSKEELSKFMRLTNESHVEKFVDLCTVKLHEFTFYLTLFTESMYTSDYICKYLSQSEAIKQAEEALKFIHKKCSIIHHDLCPDNIMLNKVKNEYRLIIIDFKFSSSKKKQIIKKFCFVKPYYRHPQLWKDPDYLDNNIDYWAAYASLFEIYNNGMLLFKSQMLENYYRLQQSMEVYSILSNIIVEKSLEELEYFQDKKSWMYLFTNIFY
jgi:serine/threonine protein kinase